MRVRRWGLAPRGPPGLKGSTTGRTRRVFPNYIRVIEIIENECKSTEDRWATCAVQAAVSDRHMSYANRQCCYANPTDADRLFEKYRFAYKKAIFKGEMSRQQLSIVEWMENFSELNIDSIYWIL